MEDRNRLSSRELVGWLMGYARPFRALFTILISVSLLEILVGLSTPWTMKILVDNVLGGQPWPVWLRGVASVVSTDNRVALLIAVCSTGLLLGLTNQALSLWHTQLQVGIGQKMLLSLQKDLFDHLQGLSLRYHQQKGTGDAIYRLNNDSWCVSNIVIQGVFPLATSVITLLLMFLILLWLEWSLALLSLIVIPPLYIVINHYSAKLAEKTEKVKEMESGIFNLVHEVFSSIKIVKAFSRERFESERFAAKNSQKLDQRLKVTFQESLFAAVVGSLMLTGTAAVLFAGGWHILRGSLTVGELLVVLAYLGSVYAPLSAIGYTIGSLQDSLASARRVYMTLHLTPNIVETPGKLDVPAIRGHIRFDNVSFAYDDADMPVLRDINMDISPGEMVAIVGLTGAGKSTLVSLIPRFYDVTSGRILVDGIDVRDLSLKRLRESISIVTQEPILFSSSVAENIRYGRLNASLEEIHSAAKAAQAHRFIERMKNGYETSLGDSGNQLSGGERQRLSIARALLKNAPILILDEPTSALDSRSESLVFSALRGLVKGRTTIVIAHRLSTIRGAEKIVVLDGGRIAAQGKHEELVVQNELYKELYERLLVGLTVDEGLIATTDVAQLALEAN